MVRTSASVTRAPTRRFRERSVVRNGGKGLVALLPREFGYSHDLELERVQARKERV
jgi:hypothetical protein